MLGLKSLMPVGMFGENGAFRGKVHESFETLRRAILGYLEDEHMPINGGFVMPLTDEQRGKGNEATAEHKDVMTEEDMLANLHAKGYLI